MPRILGQLYTQKGIFFSVFSNFTLFFVLGLCCPGLAFFSCEQGLHLAAEHDL